MAQSKPHANENDEETTEKSIMYKVPEEAWNNDVEFANSENTKKTGENGFLTYKSTSEE